MTSKLAWVLLALAIAFVLFWLGPVDFVAGQSLEDTVTDSTR